MILSFLRSQRVDLSRNNLGGWEARGVDPSPLAAVYDRLLKVTSAQRQAGRASAGSFDVTGNNFRPETREALMELLRQRYDLRWEQGWKGEVTLYV